MEILIDGIEYVPASSKTITVHNIEYSSVSNWLFNIRAVLLLRWSNYLSETNGDINDPKVKELGNRIQEFDKFAKGYLGFDCEGPSVKPIDGWTLEDYGKIKEDKER